MLLFLSSCLLFEWEDEGDYQYIAKIENDTNDSLLIVFGESMPIVDSVFLLPDSFASVQSFKAYEGSSIIRGLLFNQGAKAFEERMRVYRNDTLLVDWYGPAKEMSIDIHHFYNYNSWESWLIEGTNNGIVQFTIYESDFNIMK